MKLIAKKTVIVKLLGATGPFGAKTVRAGEEFEVDDDQGSRLIKNGNAVEKPKATRRAAAKAEGSAE